MNFLRTFFASLLGTIVAFVVGFILFFMIIGSLASSLGSEETASAIIQDNSILSLKLDLPILDNIPGTQNFQISLGLDPESVKLIDIVTAIELAKTNDKIKGIHLRSDYLMAGWSQDKRTWFDVRT